MIIVMQRNAGEKDVNSAVEKKKGADGLTIAVHPRPGKAMVDGPQSLNFAQFGELMREVRPIAKALGREI